MRTDAQLLAAARTDAGAFRELYDRHATAVHRFHLGRSRDADAALDLTAETFAQAWLSRERFRDLAGGSAGPWLYGIARHVLVASVRRRELERSASERLGLLARPDPTEPEEQATRSNARPPRTSGPPADASRASCCLSRPRSP